MAAIEVGCPGLAGYSVTVKYEHNEPIGLLEGTDDAQRRGEQVLRNVLTNVRADIDAQLDAYADSIVCLAPCTKQIEKTTEPPFTEFKEKDGRVECYLRATWSVDVFCRERGREVEA